MADKTLVERLHQRVLARLALSKMTKRDREDNRLDTEAADALDAKDAEIARLREALRWYEDETKYSTGAGFLTLSHDKGNTARAALSK